MWAIIKSQDDRHWKHVFLSKLVMSSYEPIYHPWGFGDQSYVQSDGNARGFLCPRKYVAAGNQDLARRAVDLY